MDALICRCPRGHADERVLLSVQELLNRIATLGFRREPPSDRTEDLLTTSWKDSASYGLYQHQIPTRVAAAIRTDCLHLAPRTAPRAVGASAGRP